MKRFQHILIALPPHASHDGVLAWTRQIAGTAGTKRLDFVLLDPEPADWVAEFPAPAGGKPGQEQLEELSETIADRFGDLGAELNTRSAVGAPLASLLHELADGEADLVVVGVENEVDRRLAEKLTRKCPASVLSIPAGASAECRSILTPVDFSEPASRSLDIAVAFARGLAADNLVCLHSFQVTNRAVPAGITISQLREDYRRIAAFQLAELVRKNTPGFEGVETIVRENILPSSAILDELSQGTHQLVVMATRGRSSVARALLGSNTADVIRQSPVPVLAVKAKGEGLSFLRDLLANSDNTSSNPPLST